VIPDFFCSDPLPSDHKQPIAASVKQGWNTAIVEGFGNETAAGNVPELLRE